MQIMRMTYNDLTKGGGEAKLHVYGVGTFPVFSGQNPTPTILTARFEKQRNPSGPLLDCATA